MDKFHGVLDHEPRLRRRRPFLPDWNFRLASVLIGRMDRGRRDLLRRSGRGELLRWAAAEDRPCEPERILDWHVLWLIKDESAGRGAGQRRKWRKWGGKSSDLGAKA